LTSKVFSNGLSHEWLVKFIEHRVADRRVVRLIQKWLNAGVLEMGNGIRWGKNALGRTVLRRFWRPSIFIITCSTCGSKRGVESERTVMSSCAIR